MVSIEILDVHLDRAFYFPTDTIKIFLKLHSKSQSVNSVSLIIEIKHLNILVDRIVEPIELSGGEQTVEIQYSPPSEAPRGYGLDICIVDEKGNQLDCLTTAFDVLNNWSESPRYGFLSEFHPDRIDISETIKALARYHINGIQFYDWMYRHDQFLTQEDTYKDPMGRDLSFTTVENFISAAHEQNIAAMPYTAIYAASVAFFEAHPEWALYKSNGDPHYFGEDFLVYMDPRPDSPWVAYLMAQFDQILQQTDFDGIHLDSYGDPKESYDAQGNNFGLADPIAATINLTKELVLSYRSNGNVVFNAVTNWPIETAAPSDQDFSYIEVWPPYIWFDDLHNLIVNAQDLGNGKPVVLAAYIDPSFEHNVRLVDAVIIASGGGHIELGENNAMLADAYFPRFKIMDPELISVMQRYYDFAVRYQDVIGPRTVDATIKYQNEIEIEGVSTAPGQRSNKIWPIFREGEGFLAISILNFLGLDSPEWAKELATGPISLGPSTFRLFNVDKGIDQIWVASGDTDDISPKLLPYNTESDNTISFEIPSLEYWNIIVIEWSD